MIRYFRLLYLNGVGSFKARPLGLGVKLCGALSGISGEQPLCLSANAPGFVSQPELLDTWSCLMRSLSLLKPLRWPPLMTDLSWDLPLSNTEVLFYFRSFYHRLNCRCEVAFRTKLRQCHCSIWEISSGDWVLPLYSPPCLQESACLCSSGLAFSLPPTGLQRRFLPLALLSNLCIASDTCTDRVPALHSVCVSNLITRSQTEYRKLLGYIFSVSSPPVPAPKSCLAGKRLLWNILSLCWCSAFSFFFLFFSFFLSTLLLTASILYHALPYVGHPSRRPLQLLLVCFCFSVLVLCQPGVSERQREESALWWLASTWQSCTWCGEWGGGCFLGIAVRFLCPGRQVHRQERSQVGIQTEGYACIQTDWHCSKVGIQTEGYASTQTDWHTAR